MLRPALQLSILVLCALLPGCSDEKPGAVDAPATDSLPLEQIDQVLQHFNRGVGLMDRHEPGGAVKEFEEVVRLAPNWISGRLDLGIALLNTSDDEGHARAAAALGWVTENHPDNPYAHYSLGVMYRDLSREDDALRCFQRVLEIDPGDPDTHYQLAMLLANTDVAAARAHLEAVLKAIPHHESAVYRLQALMRESGEEEQAARLVERFQELKDKKAGVAIGMKYGEMGRYAEVIRAFELEREPRPAGPATELKDVAAEIGLDGATECVPGWPGEERTQWARLGASAFGPGLGVADLNGDGRLDVCMTGTAAGVDLYLAEGERFRKLAETGIDGENSVGAFFGDADGDGDPDLYLTCAGRNRLYRNEDGLLYTDITDRSGTAGDELLSVGASFVDADHDGDLDLFVANFCSWPLADTESPGAPNALFRNNGDGSFTDVAKEAGVDGGPAPSVGVLPFDADGDMDLDLYVINHRAKNDLFLNDRIGRYRAAGERFAVLADDGAGTGALLGDFDRNGLDDLLLLRGPEPPVLYTCAAPGRFNGNERPLLGGFSRAQSALAGDLDLDGNLDLALLDTGPAGALRHALLMNQGDGTFAAPVWFGQEHAVSEARGAVAADLNGDGSLELLVARAGASPEIFRGEPPAGNHWLEVVPFLMSEREGLWLDPNASGMHLEVQTGTGLLGRTLSPSSGYLSSPPLLAHFGLGPAVKSDYVRLAWPDGTIQSELEIAADQVWQINKISRKPSSCPVLFCWDGDRYSFVTDFLGVGGVGFFVKPGEYAPPDPTEDVRIPPEQTGLRNGRYSLRVVEPLEEVAYIDQLQLFVYDHPADLELYPDERFTGTPPFPTGRAQAVRERIFPETATDDRGRSVLERLLRVDRQYVEPPTIEGMVGYAADHWVELDFGDRLRDVPGRRILYLNGWVEYTYSHVNYAAYQAGLEMRSPAIEVPDGQGGFRVAIPEAGFPAGLPRMMTLDVSDLPLCRDGRLRIRTNMEVFWDQIFIGPEVDVPELRRHVLEPEVADLRRFGYPREYSPDGQDPTLYDYQRLDHGVPFKIMSGDYTKFGDVRPLLNSVDDRFVIMGRGEELRLEFDARKLPPLQEGWARTVVLHSDGYCKDMDLYTAFPDTVGPLPHHGMENYPPVQPNSAETAGWQTRRVLGENEGE
ncbi:MAG: FG-GAP-like repeat-containing protein [Planctomycetota bacterium]